MSNEAQEAMQEVSKEAGEGTESRAQEKIEAMDAASGGEVWTREMIADVHKRGEELSQRINPQAAAPVSERAQSDKLGQAETKTDNVADIRQAQKEKDAEGVRVEVTNETKHVAHAFRQLADKIEEGELNNLDFAIVIPKLVNGDMPMLFLGNPIPNVMLEGLLHRMLTKMAFQ